MNDFKKWYYYFKGNLDHLDLINFHTAPCLTSYEKNIIWSSIQQFQKGENSEGKHLIQHAKNYNNENYLDTIKLFIKEEQMHARLLGEFMAIEKIPKIRSHWIDSGFRWIRNLMGLELSVTVLVTAEIIAAVYYQGLKAATNSGLLVQICNRLLKDETKHLEFQAYTIAHINQYKGYLHRSIKKYLHLGLVLATLLLVWLQHQKVLTNGGFGLTSFFKAGIDIFLQLHKDKETFWHHLQQTRTVPIIS